jgi:hypothetical protein
MVGDPVQQDRQPRPVFLALDGTHAERVTARQDLVGDHARPEKVRRLARRAAGDDLRGKVGDRPGRAALSGRLGRRNRDPEVDQLHRPVHRHHQVRRLDVAVEDALAVQGAEALEHLYDQLQALLARTLSPWGDQGGRTLGRRFDDVAGTFQRLHREEGAVVLVEPVVEDPDDVAVPEARKDLELAGDLLPGAAEPTPLDARRSHLLQRDLFAGQPVPDQEDLPHTATAEPTEQGVTVVDGAPGLRQSAGRHLRHRVRQGLIGVNTRQGLGQLAVSCCLFPHTTRIAQVRGQKFTNLSGLFLPRSPFQVHRELPRSGAR